MTTELPFHERFRCTALSKRSGERCRRAAHPGASVCVMHGAGSPQVRASARRRLEQRRVQTQLGKLMVELEDEALQHSHPVEVLGDAVNRSDALVRILGSLVAQLDGRHAGTWEKPAALYGPNHLGDAAPHVLVVLYNEALDRAAKLSKLAIDARLDERQVALNEATAEVLVGVVHLVAGEIGAMLRRRLRYSEQLDSIETWFARELPAVIRSAFQAQGQVQPGGAAVLEAQPPAPVVEVREVRADEW